QRIVSSDISSRISTVLYMGMGRQAKKENFKSSDIGLIIWKLTDLGSDPIAQYIPKDLILPDLAEVVITMMGQMFTTVLGQGEYYHEGLFGPLPVPVPNSDLRCLLSSKTLKDSSQQDHRIRSNNYTLVGLILSRYNEIDITALEEILDSWWSSIHDLADFSIKNFDFLKSTILSKPLKLII
ncbi:MAG: hypothetical protein ACFFD1_13430, partial [Candidatus Thorarchaeota archaeon]